MNLPPHLAIEAGIVKILESLLVKVSLIMFDVFTLDFSS